MLFPLKGDVIYIFVTTKNYLNIFFCCYKLEIFFFFVIYNFSIVKYFSKLDFDITKK